MTKLAHLWKNQRLLMSICQSNLNFKRGPMYCFDLFLFEKKFISFVFWQIRQLTWGGLFIYLFDPIAICHLIFSWSCWCCCHICLCINNPLDFFYIFGFFFWCLFSYQYYKNKYECEELIAYWFSPHAWQAHRIKDH